jgi:hypothetical protein
MRGKMRAGTLLIVTIIALMIAITSMGDLPPTHCTILYDGRAIEVSITNQPKAAQYCIDYEGER